MRIIVLLFGALVFVSSARADLTEEYPELKKFVFQEPRSRFKFGFGVGPLAIVNKKNALSASLFQLHWDQRYFDIEVVSFSVATVFSKQSNAGSRNFTIRSAPKFKLLDFLSIGPAVGIEFVSFPDVGAVLSKGGFATPVEPFSSSGLVYGIVLSQTFEYKEGLQIKLNQSIYRQTYSTSVTGDGWSFVFDQPEIQNDPERDLIKPSWVFLIDVSLLF